MQRRVNDAWADHAEDRSSGQRLSSHFDFFAVRSVCKTRRGQIGLRSPSDRYTSRSVDKEAEYEIGAELGRGAIGRVVIVTTPTGDRLAGKILHDSQKSDERARARFAGEAEIAAGLRHENVAQVHGLVEIDGESVLLMELVEGDSLRAIIAKSGPLSDERVVRLGAQLARGLEAAHHAGLIHRDLKPDNILVSSEADSSESNRETAKIVDFGLARASSFAGVDDGAFAVVGTPDYMAPESIDPLAVDARSDLYALGCILFEMATTEPPFRRRDRVRCHRRPTATPRSIARPSMRFSRHRWPT